MDVSNIKDRFDRGESLDYLFFWSHRPNPDAAVGKTFFSQWFEAIAILNEILAPM